MRSSRFALSVLAALSSGACNFAADITGTSLVAGNEHGGTVSRVTTITRPGAVNKANAWCGQYGLAAVETRVAFVNDSMDFACVPPPSQ